jgi:glycosyltransferase involved in cell wall biosynthesis
LEAIACGTPVAALPFGAMSEIINGHSGVLATGHDAEALARAVVLARELDRSKVRASARCFSLDSMIDAYEGHLRSVVPMPQCTPGRLS